MTRLAAARDTHLTPDEIAGESLRQFDGDGTDPSIRSLAAALQVGPSAIYHHFPSRAAIVQATVELVWQEVTAEFAELVPDPLDADPVEILVGGAIATRRAWYRHYRVAPYMAATPESNKFLSATLALLANVFERLGLEGEEAAASYHAYASFTIGSVLFVAARRRANEQLAAEDEAERFHSAHTERAAELSSEATRLAFDDMMEVSAIDPARDEQLFEQDLRRLITSFGSG